jgi:hypothetical protein
VLTAYPHLLIRIEQAIADEISILRFQAARLECWLFGHPLPPEMIEHRETTPDGSITAKDKVVAIQRD